MERRLTTILAADVVGYSRLMGADEAGTLAALKGHRVQLFDQAGCRGDAHWPGTPRLWSLRERPWRQSDSYCRRAGRR